MTARTSDPRSSEHGVALVMTLLVMMMMAALLIGFTTIITSDQRFRFIDHDRGQAFYGASGAMEKLTADLGNVFLKNVAPSNAQITALTSAANQPVITNVSYTSTATPTALTSSELSTFHCYSTAGPPAVNRGVVTVGTNGYAITFCANTANNNPTTTADPSTILSGTYAGLYGLKAPYQLDVTAKTTTGGEVHLIRSMEAVSIPVFQFGIFSDVDLAFNAAQDFSFGGRVHTNGNLFLAQAAGTTLTLTDKVTAVKEVVRQNLSNGNTIDSNSDTGTVSLAKGGGAFTTMLRTWGSVVAGPTSGWNEPTWTTVSLSTYKGYIKNGRTGAKELDLPLIAVGGKNTDLSRRPPAGEDTTGILFNERLFSKASLRVLLSDTPADLTNLPTADITAAPVSLETGTFGGIPIAQSPGLVTATVGGGSSTTVQMKGAGAIPGFFLLPNITATKTVGATTYTFTINACTAKAAAQISGCFVAVAPAGGTLANGDTITAVNVGGSGVNISTTLSGNGAAIAAGAGKTIKVVSTNNMSPQTFWVQDTVATCATYDQTTAPQQFATCTMSRTPANNDTLSNFALSDVGTSLIGGYIKIEQQISSGTWKDITAQVLGYGIGAPSQSGPLGTSCDTAAFDPSPNAIVRLQRLHDSGMANAATANCTPVAQTGKYDYWPNSLFDTREAWARDTAPTGTNIKIGGVMYYVEIDATNLAKWFSHTAPYNTVADTGNQSLTDNGGYSLYISDRRNNRDANSLETGEWGWEDFVNPLSPTATPNGILDAGEDVNQNGALDVYGGVPNCNGTYNTLGPVTVNGLAVTCASSFYTTALTPQSDLVTAAETFNGVGRAMVNRPVMFRRAIKLVHGTALSTYVTGLTVVTENPVYIQGDWNVPAGSCTGALVPTAAHAATSIIADSVTVMSSNWTDPLSFASPYSANGRSKRTSNSCYRAALLAGKSVIFPWINGTGTTYGTDGGAHSFIRFLEDNAATTDAIRYRGSLATFFYSRQAVGIFKGNSDYVYGIPTLRDYVFDTDFQTPALLPPLTPVFRDMNAVGFSQELRPNK